MSCMKQQEAKMWDVKLIQLQMILVYGLLVVTAAIDFCVKLGA